MKSTKIQPRRNGVHPSKLNPSQLLWVNTMAADIAFDPVAAVRECYPKNKNPASQAAKLLSNRNVMKALSVVLRKRLERLELKADDVLEYLRFALFFNPLDHFFPTEDGKWTIANLKDLPDEVGRLIDKMKVKERTNVDGSTTVTFEVELISKATVLSLAMKHMGIDGEKTPVMLNIDWDALSQRGNVIDVTSQRLLEEDKK